MVKRTANRSNRHRLGTVLLPALLLGGCAVSASHLAPVPADPQLVEQVTAPLAPSPEGAQQNPRWWHAFADAQLDQLVEEALAHNHDLGAAALRLDAELARLAVARDQRRPQGGVNGGLDVTRQQREGDGRLATRKQADIGVGAEWQLDLFGRIRAAIRGAEAGLDQRYYAQQAAKATVVTGVVDSYIQLMGVERQLQVLAQQLTAIDASVATLQVRVDEGAATPLELYRAQALHHEFLARQPLLEEQRADFRSALATLVGRAGPQLRLDADAFSLPAVESLKPTLTHPGPALLQAPELRQARARVAQAAALSDQARASLYPDISVTGVVGWLSAGTLDLGDGDQQLGFSPRLHWSLLNLAALQAGLDAAQQEERALLREYQQTLLRVLNRADRSLATWNARNRRLVQSNLRHRFARQAFDQARANYEEGVIPYLEFLDAQRDLLESENALVTVQTAWTRAYTELYRAFPGTWLPALQGTRPIQPKLG